MTNETPGIFLINCLDTLTFEVGIWVRIHVIVVRLVVKSELP